ncbi:RHS repeat-associated core domain-containing protein [Pseudomonas sp. BJa3]|uniref:RHS repeat-associated core domain-containing protein n=1 Tax=Pseudomonas sp. BJa3 TaxID=2986525 RepID=UPI0022659E2B|nr:RHS repeat-associated core domain-containing protein [Pseudomonas sp. BJa3]MCX5508464.1 RHS repeat-associated core domain-containing protein [Pseudomonas sp. BJa3]
MRSNRQKTKIEACLLVTDNHGSVIGTQPPVTSYHLVYTIYGYSPGGLGLDVMLGFNGQRKAPVTGCYPLGNGYRDYDPYLMRFRSPDNLSPFTQGGINAYSYCAGEPVNSTDPSGHIKLFDHFKNIDPVKKWISQWRGKLDTNDTSMLVAPQKTSISQDPLLIERKETLERLRTTELRANSDSATRLTTTLNKINQKIADSVSAQQHSANTGIFPAQNVSPPASQSQKTLSLDRPYQVRETVDTQPK